MSITPPPLPNAPGGGAPRKAVGLRFCLLVAVIGLIGAWVVNVSRVQLENHRRQQYSHRIIACIANLKQIDGAVQEWALENKKVSTDSYSLTDPNILRYLKGSVLPICHQGGVYSAGKTVADVPKCSMSDRLGHSL